MAPRIVAGPSSLLYPKRGTDEWAAANARRQSAQRAAMQQIGAAGMNFDVAGALIYIDLRPAVQSLGDVLAKYSDEVQNLALYNALNYAGDQVRTAVRRDVAKQSGAKYGDVMKVIVADRAHPNRLYYRLNAADKPMLLSAFATKANLVPGKKNPYAKPWNRSRRFKGAFVVKFKSGGVQIVKRTGDRNQGTRKRDGSGSIKVLYGPIIPREMVRAGSPSMRTILGAIQDKVVPRIKHELVMAEARVAARSK